MILRRIVILCMLFCSMTVRAQFNVDRLITNGEVALHYEDYVLSIQYFSQAISLKPYLYQPWQYRGVAKYFLDDFIGAENDATHALQLNPYVEELYDLRAICRIRQKKFDEAITDYTQAIRLNPRERNYRYNRAICHAEKKDFSAAQLDADTILSRWSDFANAYTLKAELYLQSADTLKAAQWLDEGLKKDPYSIPAWQTRAAISLSRKQWKAADEQLSQVIHLQPTVANNYVNRALARYNINNLRGAMSDYDMAIDLDPNNFLAHYNRGQLRMQLGDDNRAINDFDFIIKLEPQNFLAIFNRALLNDRTGNLRDAIRDYSTVIAQFPNFWYGLAQRAKCYRKLGMTAKAELDEFKILKAQNDKHFGIQPRWSKNKRKEVRKRSEIDPEKYNQLVEEDPDEMPKEYQSPYRGKIQHRSVSDDFMPLYTLSFFRYKNGVQSKQLYCQTVEDFNQTAHPRHNLYINCNPQALSEQQSTAFFALEDTITAKIQQTRDTKQLTALLLQRSVAYTILQDREAAINDLTAALELDSANVLALWQRAICYSQAVAAKTTLHSTSMSNKRAIDDLNSAIKLQPDNPYLYYNRANIFAQQGEYDKAVNDYTEALKIDSHLAEAYYNRALARQKLNASKEQDIQSDLSRAGELGLFKAYSILRQQTKKKK